MTDHDTDDQYPERWELDQAAASVRDAAPLLAACYRALRAEGLDPLEASLLASMHICTLGIEMPDEEG